MPEIIEVLPKWVTSSVRKGFVDRAKDIPTYFEETIKENNEDPLYYELRIDGPFLDPFGSRDEWRAIIEVNCLIGMGFDEKDSLKMAKLIGIAQAALSKDFCIFKYGTESYDNDSQYFGTMVLITADRVEAANFGQINETNKIFQSTVEAHYQMEFLNGSV